VRNRDFILDILRDVLPMTGVILEIASGSGEHGVHLREIRIGRLENQAPVASVQAPTLVFLRNQQLAAEPIGVGQAEGR
jgi:hypothetical protein